MKCASIVESSLRTLALISAQRTGRNPMTLKLESYLTGGQVPAEHPYIRSHGSEPLSNMFEVERPPAVSYI